jgi:Asp-tRNA(Asn)/Glu-tRNA(Gln) amidotransferase C subunit
MFLGFRMRCLDDAEGEQTRHLASLELSVDWHAQHDEQLDDILAWLFERMNESVECVPREMY